jgi:hypothetical protein
MNLKDIELDGIQMKYEIFSESSEYGDYYWTEFYIGTKTLVKRKYGLFGEKIKKEIPFKVFQLNISIEDPDYTKKDIRERIERKLELLGRKSEIERGEIV